MRGFFLSLTLSCSSVVANEPPPGAASESPAVLTAFLYDTVGIPAGVVRIAMEHASSVYAPAGIDLVWTTCPAWREDGVDGCRHSLRSDELVVRIVRHAEPARWNPGGAALGVALVTEGAPGHYASVFFDRIQQFSAAYRIPPGVTLGSAIAHEIGHLLLKSNVHAVAGLMRKHWDRESQRRAEQGRLRLLPAEAARVRAEALSRGKEARESAAKLAAEGLGRRR